MREINSATLQRRQCRGHISALRGADLKSNSVASRPNFSTCSDNTQQRDRHRQELVSDHSNERPLRDAVRCLWVCCLNGSGVASAVQCAHHRTHSDTIDTTGMDPPLAPYIADRNVPDTRMLHLTALHPAAGSRHGRLCGSLLRRIGIRCRRRRRLCRRGR